MLLGPELKLSRNLLADIRHEIHVAKELYSSNITPSARSYTTRLEIAQGALTRYVTELETLTVAPPTARLESEVTRGIAEAAYATISIARCVAPRFEGSVTTADEIERFNGIPKEFIIKSRVFLGSSASAMASVFRLSCFNSPAGTMNLVQALFAVADKPELQLRAYGHEHVYLRALPAQQAMGKFSHDIGLLFTSGDDDKECVREFTSAADFQTAFFLPEFVDF